MPSPSRLKLTVRRSLLARLVRRRDATDTRSVARVRLENGVFRPGAGLSIVCHGAAEVTFPEPGGMEIAAHASMEGRVRGEAVIGYARNHIEISGLTVELNPDAIALVGEMAQPLHRGELSVSVAGGEEPTVLRSYQESRPFALPAPRKIVVMTPETESRSSPKSVPQSWCVDPTRSADTTP